MKQLHCAFQSNTLTQREWVELRVYRALGILTFRRFLFSLERFRHRKDGQTNRNYHMRSLSAGGAAAFEGYLIYHDVLHGISLMLLAITLLGKVACALPWNGMDILAIGMCVFNLWCLMLQRYNRLRLRQLCAKARRAHRVRLSRETELLLTALEEIGPTLETGEALTLAQEILARLSVGEIVYLESEDIPALCWMAALLEKAGLERRMKTFTREVRAVSQPADRLAENLAIQAQPYSRVERRADWIQRKLLPRRKPLLSPCAIVTEDGQTEAAFSALFPQSSPERIWERLTVLAVALEHLSAKGV